MLLSVRLRLAEAYSTFTLAKSHSSSSATIIAIEVRTPWPMSDLATLSVTELSGSMTTKALTSSGDLSVSGLHGSPAMVVAPANSGANAAIISPPAADSPAWINERRESMMVIRALPSDLDQFGGAMNRGADARVGPAAADIGHPVVDVGVARMGIVRDERNRGHDLPRLAIAALRRVGLDPRLLHRAQLFLAKALDSQDRPAGGDAYRSDARPRRLAVDEDGAGAAEPRAAAEFCPDHAEFVAKRPQEGHVRLDVDRELPPVDGKTDHGPHRLRSRMLQRDTGSIGAREVRQILAPARSNRRERRTNVREGARRKILSRPGRPRMISILPADRDDHVLAPVSSPRPPARRKPGARLADGRAVPRSLRAGPSRNRPHQARGRQGHSGRAVQASVGLLPVRSRPFAGRGVAAQADAPRPGLVRGPVESALQSPGSAARRRLHGPDVARRPSL